ncbi:MAG: ABC transporter permease [Clostridium sp.]|nr:ABC transporter permease [Clostridium sp.]
MKVLREIYQYRTMISSLIKRDLRGRYKGSLLGFAWTFLNPLLQLAVYTIVFSTIMRAGIEDYYLFLFVALIPWIFFSSSVSGGASCIISQKELVKKIYFPREILPIAHVTCQLVNMFFSFIVVFAVLLISGKGVSFIAMLYLPIVVVAEYLLAISIAMVVSAVTVYFRDLEHILVILMMAWQFLSPVMYSVDMIPEKLRPIFSINPMSPIIIAYRDILYYKQVPAIGTLLYGCIISVVVLVIGWFAFGRLKRRFAEEL